MSCPGRHQTLYGVLGQESLGAHDIGRELRYAGIQRTCWVSAAPGMWRGLFIKWRIGSREGSGRRKVSMCQESLTKTMVPFYTSSREDVKFS